MAEGVSGLSKDDTKKLSKEEIQKIFDKYTKYFHEYMSGTYKEKEEDKDENDND